MTTLQLNIDTEKPCTICGKPGAVNDGICLECASWLVGLSKQERSMVARNQAIFAAPDVPKCPKCNNRPSVNMGACLECVEASLKAGKGASLKHLPDRWPADARVILAAKELMGEHHPEAKFAAVAFLFRRKHSEQNGRVRLGSCARQSPTNTMLHGWDYVIELAWDMWAMLDSQQREALLLHEICHIFQDDSGEGVAWKIEPHNVEAFVKEVEIYGLWKPDLAAFAKAIQVAEEAADGPRQMSMEEFARRRLEFEDVGPESAEVN